MAEYLDIVNDRDEVIDVVERSEASRRGLGYRIIYVLFYTAAGEIILQRRHPSKSFGGMLTTTVSGHVESGMSYAETAVKETKEETGVELEEDDLIDLGKRAYQAQRGMRHAGIYLYEYRGKFTDLVVEESEGDGFVAVPIDALKEAVRQGRPEFALFAFGEFTDRVIGGVERQLALK